MKHGLIEDGLDHFREMIKDFKNPEVATSYVARESEQRLRAAAGMTNSSARVVLEDSGHIESGAWFLDPVQALQDVPWASETARPSRAGVLQLHDAYGGISETMWFSHFGRASAHAPSLVAAR